MTGKNNVPWTEQDLADMRQMRFVDKMSLKNIGAHFGVSRERIRQLIGNTGYIIPTLEEKIKNIPNADIMTRKELANKFGVSESRVRYVFPGSQHRKIILALKNNFIHLNKMRGKHLQNYYVANHKYLIKICHAYQESRPSSPHIKSLQYHFVLRGIVPDFYIFYIEKTNDVFVVPSFETKDMVEVQFCFPIKTTKASKFQKYHNRFDLLV